MKRSSFICEENQVSIEEDNLSEKVVTTEEELDPVDVDGNGNLVVSLGLCYRLSMWKS